MDRVRRIVAQAQALNGDVIALLGDYPGHLPFSRPPEPDALAAALAELSAPLGVWSVFGNHDWLDDPEAVARAGGETTWHRAFRRAGIGVLENTSTQLSHEGAAFCLAGLGSQQALVKNKSVAEDGVDNLAAAHAETGGRPTILLAHEPDIFSHVPDQTLLTLSGHTHGGQVRVFGLAPVVPAHGGRRFRYGHFAERGRHLVVSGGIGCSNLPIRIGQPPELTVVTLSGG